MVDNADYRRAVAYLRSAQRQAYLSRGINPEGLISDSSEHLEDFLRRAFATFRQGDDQSLDDFVAANKNEILGSREYAPSPYEDLGSFAILRSLTVDLRRSLDDFEIKLAKEPIFGTLPSGNINGVALSFPNSAYWLIVFETGLFGFANLFCKAVANVLPLLGETLDGGLQFSIEPSLINEAIDRDPELLERFSDVLFSYVIGGDPYLAQPYLPHKNRIALIEALCNGMELFVVGHEYGHCCAGHLDEVDDLTQSSEAVWGREYVADAIGLMLTIRSMQRKGFDLALSIAGMEMWFICVHVIEKTVGILSGDAEKFSISMTHPPALARRESIRRRLREQVDEGFEGAEQLGDNIFHVVEAMWLRLMPMAQELYRTGQRPHAIWS